MSKTSDPEPNGLDIPAPNNLGVREGQKWVCKEEWRLVKVVRVRSSRDPIHKWVVDCEVVGSPSWGVACYWLEDFKRDWYRFS